MSAGHSQIDNFQGWYFPR